MDRPVGYVPVTGLVSPTRKPPVNRRFCSSFNFFFCKLLPIINPKFNELIYEIPKLIGDYLGKSKLKTNSSYLECQQLIEISFDNL